MKKILIVDDSSLILAVIRNFIKKMSLDVEIIEAKSGEEALEKYRNDKPNLVFMDIKMTGMDGITTLEEIKKFDSNAKVAMCTSLKEAEQEQRAKKAGCVAYIMKPFNSKDIEDTINNNL